MRMSALTWKKRHRPKHTEIGGNDRELGLALAKDQLPLTICSHYLCSSDGSQRMPKNLVGTQHCLGGSAWKLHELHRNL